MSITPPKFFDRLLKWYCSQTELEDIHGDFYEIFLDRYESSPFKAKCLFIFDVLNLFNPFSKHRKPSTWLGESYQFNFQNQIKVSFRYLKKYPFISSLKIVGLSIAISAFFFISDYVRFHTNFDSFHEKKDRIYRVVTTVNSPDLQDVTAWSHSYIKDFEDEFSGVEEVVRLLKAEEAVIVNTSNKQFKETRVFYADEEFAHVFTYEWLEGDKSTALIEPYSVILTRNSALKYFNTSHEIIGRQLSIGEELYEITGLIENPPINSDLKFDLLMPFTSWTMEEWTFVYLLLNPDTEMEEVKRVFEEEISFLNDDYTDQGVSLDYDFEKITDIHFSEPKLYDTPKVSRQRILLFQVLGWIILLVAIVNFINLYSTQLLGRIRNVNVQMAIGATRKQLILQFATESFLYLGIALSIGFGLTYVSAGVLSNYANFPFFSLSISSQSIAYLGLAFCLSILLFAVYALVLSTSKSNNQLFQSKTIKAHFRKILIGVQFGLSFAMVLGTIIIYQQTSLLLNQPLGFNPDQLIHFQVPNRQDKSKIDILSQEFKKLNFVESVSRVQSNSTPGMDAWVEEFYFPELDQMKLFEELSVDDQYLEVLKINLLAGEFFNSKKHRRHQAFVVNKAFVDHMGWNMDDAVGKRLEYYQNNAPIIGVVQNFHFNSPHQLVQPFVLTYSSNGPFAIVRLDTSSDLKKALPTMANIWNSHFPALPFNFSFLKSDYEQQFEEEQATINVLGIIASLVIGLSLLGMYAILLMLGKFREKEFGIRKVNGASTFDLFFIFSREFVKILWVSIAVATPFSWVAMSNWLMKYPIRISLSPFHFIVVASITLLIAWTVIYFQAIKSYRSNTVDSLKYE